MYIYIFIYLIYWSCFFFSCFSVGPPGVGPEHPSATFQRYKTSLEVAQAQVDLRDLQIPGLTAKPLRTSLAPFKQPAAAKGAPEVIRAPKGARGSVQEVLFVHQLWRVALLQEVTFVHHYWIFLSTKEFSFYIQVKYVFIISFRYTYMYVFQDIYFKYTYMYVFQEMQSLRYVQSR